MFSRSYKQIPQGPQTPMTPVEMSLLPGPSSVESTPKIGWAPPAARTRDGYFVEEEDDARQKNYVPIVLEYRQKDITRKIRIRMLRLISRIAATAVAIPTAIQEGQTLFTYAHTHNTQRNGRGPWAKETSLWPSILLFSIAVLTAVLGIAITISYSISIKAANKVSSVQDKLSIANEVGHVLVWVGVAIAYRAGKNGKDLWGWACSPLAEKIQAGFEGVVDFEKVCSRGGKQWGLTIAGAVVNVMSVFVLYMVYQRMKGKKELKRVSTMYERSGTS